MAHDDIELVAVHDEQAASVGRLMEVAAADFDAAEMRTEIVAQELVMVSRQIDHPRAFSGLAENCLGHVVMGLRPVPISLQPPAVDDVADQVDRLGLMMGQEVLQELCLAAAGAEMHVGDEKRSHVADLRLRNHGLSCVALPRKPDSDVHFMTAQKRTHSKPFALLYQAR